MSESVELIESLEKLVHRCTKCTDADTASFRALRCKGTDAAVMFVAASPRQNMTAMKGCGDVECCAEARSQAGLGKAYCTYLLKCVTPDDSIPADRLTHCLYFLQQEVEILRPRLIVTIGQNIFVSENGHRSKFNFADLLRRKVTRDVPITWTYSPDYVTAHRWTKPEIVGLYKRQHRDIKSLAERL